MRKIYLGIIAAVVVGIAYTLASPFILQPSILLSVDKDTVGYRDKASWSAEGLPPDADYETSIRWPGHVLKLRGGTADANGEASGSIEASENIPPGDFTFRVQLKSDPKRFAEVSMDLVAGEVSSDILPKTIVVSVEKTTVVYGDVEAWSVKGLPPNSDYKTTLRWPGTVLKLRGGTADANGEASDSFQVGENIPAGNFRVRVELASDPKKFGEASVDLALGEVSRDLLPKTIVVSVEKTTVRYNDTLVWSVKGLPSNADYSTMIKFSGIALKLASGTADANGEASGSIAVGENIPPGAFTFSVQLKSDPARFGEVNIDLVTSNIVLSVEKTTVVYGDIEAWSAKGLPPNSDYKVKLRWPGIRVTLAGGTADANGEASGSFLVAENIPTSFKIRVELASDPKIFGDAVINLKIPADEPYTLDIRTETIVKDLGQCGTSFVFVPDGRIFCVGVKTGKVGVIENFQLLPEPMIELDVYWTTFGEGGLNRDERGLTGITIDPEFEKNHYVYLHWSYLDSEDDKSYNRVARFTESNNKLTNMTILLDKIPAGPFHNGGPLEFGYDGKLYVTTGDARKFVKPIWRAQNMSSPAGKILRINSDGTIPEDNPTPGLPYYTLGHRNSFGIGFHPVTKIPYITENGDACCDEVNLLTPGENYGWPYFAGKQRHDKKIADEFLLGKKFVEPLLEFTHIIAPTELIFYTGDRYHGEVNNMFFLSYSNRELYRVVLEPPNYDEVISVGIYPIELEVKNAVVTKEAGGIIFNSLLDIEQGPDGYLYISSFESIMRLNFVYTDVPTTISLDAKSDARTQESIRLKAKILDYFGNPVADVPVNFFDSDKLIGSAISNQEGIAELEYTLEGADQHIITAKFAGGEKYRPSSSPEWVLQG
ncbi:MAG: PQQ-dependent sugar dehydrogenase [Nitrososphaerales archaeon]